MNESGRRRFAALAVAVIAVASAARPAEGGPVPQATLRASPAFGELETGLENLRRLLRIPGMAAGVMNGGELVWVRGFGYADLENGVEAAADTPWHIASVAKTLSAVIVLQLVEEGKLGLDDPLDRFGIPSGRQGTVRVRHILSHTSERTPGTFFRYSGRLWEHLAQVVRMSSGKPYKDNLIERIIRPLGLENTAPNRETEAEAYPFESIRDRLAVPYSMDGAFRPKKMEYGLGFFAAGGTFTSVRDMAAILAALDEARLLKPASVEEMFTPLTTPGGKTHPHGLGWFVQAVHGRRVIWHFGWHPDHASALVVRVPEKNLSFMVFANSDKLSQPFNLLRGNLLNSPAALLYLKEIAFRGEDIPEIAEREAATGDIVLKAGGWKPAIDPGPRVVLAVCLLSFLSAPLVWLGDGLRGRRRRKALAAHSRTGRGAFLARAYALTCMLLAVLICAALARAPFLAYWPGLPGWIDGISLFENIVLAAPTVLALLSIGLIGFIFPAWLDKYRTPLERIHFGWLTVCLAAFVGLLARWHLVGISYYWSYFIK